MTKLLTKKIPLMVIATISSAFAYAQTEEIKITSPVSQGTKKTSVKEELIVKESNMTYVGSDKDGSSVISGYGKDMPLLTVLKQITPQGWVVKKDNSNGGVNLEKDVSWKGGSSWNNVLGKVCQEANLQATVNYDEKTIVLSKAQTPKVQSKSSIFELEGSNTREEIKSANKTEVVVISEPKAQVKETVVIKENKPSEVVVEQKTEEVIVKKQNGKTKKEEKVVTTVIEEAPQVNQKNEYSYQLNAAKSLKENVSVWAAKAGYKLVWTGDDYPVSDSVLVAGAFDADNGPIEALSVDYGAESRVQVPLSFVFYKNKTLVVENVKYEQSGFPQYSKK